MSAKSWSVPAHWRFGNHRELDGGTIAGKKQRVTDPEEHFANGMQARTKANGEIQSKDSLSVATDSKAEAGQPLVRTGSTTG